MVSNVKANLKIRTDFLERFYVAVSEAVSQTEINNHLELGKQFLARGQLSDALTHYHAAVGE